MWQFAALNRYYAAVQADYDKGIVTDEGLRAEFRHFYDRSPDLAVRYESWVEGMPNSYAAHLARAIYYLRVGEASRGNRIIADTSEPRLSGMEVAFATASKELAASLHLEKKPLLSVFYELDIGKFEGDAATNQALFHASLAIDPKNFIVREMYLQTLMTAWGGSTEQVKAFVAESGTAGLSPTQMKSLGSVVFTDEAWVDEVQNQNYRRAATEYLEAAKLSGDDACMLCAGRMLIKAQDFPAAAAVLTRYLTRHPDSAEALGHRAYAYLELNRGLDSIRDYKRAAELGDAYSQYTVGVKYLIGEYGFEQDRAAGILWLRRAAAQGYQAAEKLLPIALNPSIAILPAPAPPPGITLSPTS